MKTAIVGCGSIGAHHAEIISEMGNVEIAAVCDKEISRAEEFAVKYNARSYTDFEAMLKDINPDTVHICTPHYLHVPMTRLALSMGIHVLCEKPPAMNFDELMSLKPYLNRASLSFCFQNRYNASVEKARALIDSGKIGKVTGASGILQWCRDRAYYEAGPWRGKLMEAGGGLMANQAIHTLDLLNCFLGTPKSVSASVSNRSLNGIIEVEDTSEGLIKYESGINAVYYATNAYPMSAPPKIEIVGEKGYIQIENKSVFIDADGEKEKFSFKLRKTSGKEVWGAGHHKMIEKFYHCIRENRPTEHGFYTVLNTQKLLNGIYESAKTGKEIVL